MTAFHFNASSESSILELFLILLATYYPQKLIILAYSTCPYL